MPDDLHFQFEPLDKGRHNRAAFSCGSEPLDRYLKEQAGQDIKNHVAAVFVATSDRKTIAGYYTLSAYAIDAGELSPEILKRLRSKQPALPATLIGRLATAKAYQGRGLGELLLMDALERAFNHSREVASLAVVVDAKNESVVRFYAQYGFIQLSPEHPNRMFLPMGTISTLFLKDLRSDKK